VWEFLEEYRREPDDAQPALLRDEPSPIGDERWDTLLAALAEHLAGRSELEHAFTALGERLARRHVVADIFVVGGAAMALAYSAH